MPERHLATELANVHTDDCPGKWTIIEDALTNKNAKGYVIKCCGECVDLAEDNES